MGTNTKIAIKQECWTKALSHLVKEINGKYDSVFTLHPFQCITLCGKQANYVGTIEVFVKVIF